MLDIETSYMRFHFLRPRLFCSAGRFPAASHSISKVKISNLDLFAGVRYLKTQLLKVDHSVCCRLRICTEDPSALVGDQSCPRIKVCLHVLFCYDRLLFTSIVEQIYGTLIFILIISREV